MAYMIVYCIQHRVSGKAYIGQTVQRLSTRLSQHRSEAFVRGSNGLLHKAIRKYGWDAFEVSVLEEASDRPDLDMAERAWIYIYGSIQPAGYNLESGGNSYKQIADSTRKAIGDRHRGKKLSPNHVDAIKRANLGNKHTFGKKASAEARARMSASRTGKKQTEARKEASRRPKSEAGRANIALAVRERCTKLSPTDRDDIIARRLAGEPRKKLADEYRVAEGTIKTVTKGMISIGRRPGKKLGTKCFPA
jgi:group I intron endonuclease